MGALDRRFGEELDILGEFGQFPYHQDCTHYYIYRVNSAVHIIAIFM